MNPIDFLLQRRSVPARQLGDPGPDEAQLEALLQAALRVPDHGKLAPWRLILLTGEPKREFGRHLAALHLEREPALPERKRQKDALRYEHAPVVVAVVASVQAEHPKVPVQEQLLSAGCVAYNLLLGAQAMGFGAQLLTGWAAYDTAVARILGLAANEHLIGFVHIGTTLRAAPARPRPALADKLQRWQP